MISFKETQFTDTEKEPEQAIAIYKYSEGKDPIALITHKDIKMSLRSKSYLTEYKKEGENTPHTNVWVNTGFSYNTNEVFRFEYNPKPRIVIGDYKLVNVEKDYIKMVDLEKNSPIL